MKVCVVKPPSVLLEEKLGAASLHLSHIIAILRNECHLDVSYSDYNTSLFYLYVKTLRYMNSTIIDYPTDLIPLEKMEILHRMIYEQFYLIDNTQKLSTILDIDRSTIEKLLRIFLIAMESIVTGILDNDCSIVLMAVSPDISFPLIIAKLLKIADPKIKIILFDNYTYEPATPYFSAFLTNKNFHGQDIKKLIEIDPMYPILKQDIPKTIDMIIEGEGYDIIRLLFKKEKNYFAVGKYFQVGKSSITRKIYSSILNERIQGVFIIKSNHSPLDGLPLPDFSDLRKIYSFAEFEITRGCSFNCVFCERSSMFGELISSHSIEYMEKLLEHIIMYNFDYYTIIDAAINVNESHTIRFLKMVKEKNFSLKYQANLRVKKANPELAKLLKDTGCIEIAIGMETGDDLLLKKMDKVQNLQMIKDFIVPLHENRIKLMIFLILAFPTETMNSVKKTINFFYFLQDTEIIDVVEVEIFLLGYIQKISKIGFENFQIQWQKPTIESITNGSRLYCNPGKFGVASFKSGMNRYEINECIKKYKYTFNKLKIQSIMSDFY